MKECVEVTGALSWPLCWEIKVWIDSANCNEGWFCDILPCFAPRHLKLGLKQRAHGNNLFCYLTFGNFKFLTSWNPKPKVSVYLSLNVLLQMIKLKPQEGSQKQFVSQPRLLKNLVPNPECLPLPLEGFWLPITWVIHLLLLLFY